MLAAMQMPPAALNSYYGQRSGGAWSKHRSYSAAEETERKEKMTAHYTPGWELNREAWEAQDWHP